MGPVGGFCYFCFCTCWVVHGPSAWNLLQYCLGPSFGALIVIIQGLFAENVLRLACCVTFVTTFYSFDCYFAFNLIFFVSLNYVQLAHTSLYLLYAQPL